MRNKLNFFFLSITLLLFKNNYGQQVPSVEENIPFLVTFSKEASVEWGDDDFVQIFFFSIPAERKEPFFIRIFDPDVSGKHDENKTGFNSRTKFSVYGGKGNYSNPDATKINPEGQFKSGVILKSKIFSSDTEFDNKWFSFGPFNPTEGELVPELGGYIFKLIIEGLEGNDGNLYSMYLSSQSSENIKVEGGNAFTYEYTFRTYDKVGSASHIYPFVSKDVISIKINSFDFDDDGKIRIVSVAKKGENVIGSVNNNWVVSEHKIEKEELNTSLDVQFIKTKPKINNNVVVYITNQYNKAIPFFATPIGGVPKYNYKIVTKKK